MDATAPDLDEQRLAVDGVLNAIGAAEVPQLLVLNKADQLERGGVPRHPGLDADRTLLISALTGFGLDALLDAIAEALRRRDHAALTAGVQRAAAVVLGRVEGGDAVPVTLQPGDRRGDRRGDDR